MCKYAHRHYTHCKCSSYFILSTRYPTTENGYCRIARIQGKGCQRDFRKSAICEEIILYGSCEWHRTLKGLAIEEVEGFDEEIEEVLRGAGFFWGEGKGVGRDWVVERKVWEVEEGEDYSAGTSGIVGVIWLWKERVRKAHLEDAAAALTMDMKLKKKSGESWTSCEVSIASEASWRMRKWRLDLEEIQESRYMVFGKLARFGLANIGG